MDLEQTLIQISLMNSRWRHLAKKFLPYFLVNASLLCTQIKTQSQIRFIRSTNILLDLGVIEA